MHVSGGSSVFISTQILTYANLEWIVVSLSMSMCLPYTQSPNDMRIEAMGPKFKESHPNMDSVQFQSLNWFF